MKRRRDPDARRPGPLVALALAFGLSLPLLAVVSSGPDFLNYADFFVLVRQGGWDAASEQRFEPAFAVTALLVAQLFDSDIVTFAVLMCAGLAIKLYVLGRATTTRLALCLVVLLYFARFLPLHELTQLRIALALAFAMLAVVRCRGLTFWIAVTAGLLMHYSVIVLMPILLLWRMLDHSPARYTRHEYLLWLSAMGIVATVGLTIQHFLEPLSLAFVTLDMYSNAGFGDDRVNPLSLSVLVDAMLLLTALPLTVNRPRLRFWWWVQAMALTLFFVLADFPVLAHRTREMLNVYWVFYVGTALQYRGLVRTHAGFIVALMVPTYIYLHFVGPNALFPL